MNFRKQICNEWQLHVMERLMELVDVEAGEVCCISNFEAKVNQVNLYMIKFYL